MTCAWANSGIGSMMSKPYQIIPLANSDSDIDCWSHQIINVLYLLAEQRFLALGLSYMNQEIHHVHTS